MQDFINKMSRNNLTCYKFWFVVYLTKMFPTMIKSEKSVILSKGVIVFNLVICCTNG